MSEVATAALTRATGNRLLNAGMWGDRIFKDIAPAAPANNPLQRPYLLVSCISDVDSADVKAETPRILWQIKAVANDQGTAYRCAAQITDLFENADLNSAKELDGGDYWVILSVRKERGIDMVELEEDTNAVYYCAGAIYRVRMKAKQIW